MQGRIEFTISVDGGLSIAKAAVLSVADEAIPACRALYGKVRVLDANGAETGEERDLTDEEVVARFAGECAQHLTSRIAAYRLKVEEQAALERYAQSMQANPITVTPE